jgi:hypothetical protein
MPYNKSTQKKYGDNPLTKKSGFKMKGWSPFTQKDDHPKKETPPEHKDLEVIKSNKMEKINDLENRISFIKEDLEQGKISTVAGGKKITELKKALVKLRGS